MIPSGKLCASTLANDWQAWPYSRARRDINFHNHAARINRQFLRARRQAEKRGETRQLLCWLVRSGRAYDRQVLRTPGRAGRPARGTRALTGGEQSAESAFSGRKAEERSRGSIIATSSESNYRPTNLITASEGAGARTDAGPEMGDAATSIVGRLITLSGCLPQATGVIRPPFIPAPGSRPPSPLPCLALPCLALPCHESRAPTRGIRKRTGRLQRGYNTTDR